jgi:hypothetical protein
MKLIVNQKNLIVIITFHVYLIVVGYHTTTTPSSTSSSTSSTNAGAGSRLKHEYENSSGRGNTANDSNSNTGQQQQSSSWSSLVKSETQHGLRGKSKEKRKYLLKFFFFSRSLFNIF